MNADILTKQRIETDARPDEAQSDDEPADVVDDEDDEDGVPLVVDQATKAEIAFPSSITGEGAEFFTDIELLMTPRGMQSDEKPQEMLCVQYASDDEDSEDNAGLELEELYCFDQGRLAALARAGATVDELTEAIQHDMVGSLERYLNPEQLRNVAVSGDGSFANVGVKVDGEFRCPECRQQFVSEHQLVVHDRFVHAPHRRPEDELLRWNFRFGFVQRSTTTTTATATAWCVANPRCACSWR